MVKLAPIAFVEPNNYSEFNITTRIPNFKKYIQGRLVTDPDILSIALKVNLIYYSLLETNVFKLYVYIWVMPAYTNKPYTYMHRYCFLCYYICSHSRLKQASRDPLDLGNYRPISNLTFLSKLLERAACEQIVGYMECHHLLPPLQSAYQKHRSTETATIKVMSDIYLAANAGLVTLLGLPDLSAAFETVDHVILLVRLQHRSGISGLALKWIESYLTGRSKFVHFNGETSVTTMVTSGFPQGSVLGPILFIAYSAEVIGIVEQLGFNVHAFADDLQVYGHAAQQEAALLATRMSTCIEGVKAWISFNRLRLNLSKMELIWLGFSRRLHHCSSTGMRVSDVDLRPVDCVRDLGVLIDSGMTLARHVIYIFGCLFLSGPTTANHPSIPHRGRCSCSGTRTHTHTYRLLQRASHFLSALSDW